MLSKTEKKISGLSEKYIYNETAASLLLLLLSHLEEMDGGLDSAYEIHGDIKAINDKIKYFTINAESLLLDGAQRSQALNDCFELKNKLIDIYRVIYGYFAKWNVISTMVSDEMAIRKYKEDPLNKEKKIELPLFYADCVDFLQTAQSPTELKSFIGELFECAPLKMTREKYFGLRENSLMEAFSQSSQREIDFSINSFKDTCAPELSKDYGEYFPDIADYLRSLNGLKAASLSDEELSQTYENLNETLDSLNQIEDYFQEMLNRINSLIILFYMGYTLEQLTEENYGWSDVYYKTRDIIQKGDEAFAETVRSMLEEYIEPLLDRANDLNKQIMDILPKIDDFSGFSDDTLKTLSTEAFVRSCFYDDLNEEVFSFSPDENDAPASKEYLKSKAGDFVNYMRDYISALPNAARKSAMRKLLGSLPLALSVEGLMEYIKESIENSSFEESLLIIDKAGAVFYSYGFSGQNEEEEESCSCGHHHGHEHNHVHSHDCSCGHHHN